MDIGDWGGGTININSECRFGSPRDYHLQANSLAVGMGSY
jgi:hypothetical protein